jgi:hypothetical protein
MTTPLVLTDRLVPDRFSGMLEHYAIEVLPMS